MCNVGSVEVFAGGQTIHTSDQPPFRLINVRPGILYAYIAYMHTYYAA